MRFISKNQFLRLNYIFCKSSILGILTFVFSFLALGNSNSKFNFISIPKASIDREGAIPCPVLLQNLKTAHLSHWTPCQVFQKYQDVRLRLIEKGLSDPSAIASWRGPRFINLPEWNRLAPTFKFNPWIIYEPYPETWQSWELGNQLILNQSLRNFKKGNVAQIDLPWLLKLHQFSMQNLFPTAGTLRDHPEVGLQLERSEALTQSTIENITSNNNSFYNLDPNKNSMISWVPTLCWEEQSKTVVEKIELSKSKKEPWFNSKQWVLNDPNQFFIDKGEWKQCGYFQYISSDQVESELNLFIDGVNQKTEMWNQNKGEEDFLLTIAKAQQFFIRIHPFKDGNGRMSRYLMDLFIESLGLPAPILRDMDKDLYLSSEDWAEEIGRGIFKTLSVLHRCLDNPLSHSCKLVSPTYQEILK